MKGPPYDHSVHFPLHGAPVLGAHAQALHPILVLCHLESKNLSKVKQILACLTNFVPLPQASPCWGQHRALAWSVWPSMQGPLQGPLFHLYIKCKVGWGTWLGNLARFTCQVNQKVVRLKVKVFFAEFCHLFLVIAVGGV